MGEIWDSSHSARLSHLETRVKSCEEDIEGHGTTMEHIIDNIDRILIPTQASHSEKIARHEKETALAHDYIMSQRGAWALVQKAGIVIAAIASLITMIMKLKGW